MAKVCSVPGCPTFTAVSGRCPAHAKEADVARGTATQRGYTGRGHRRFRSAVLAADPICVICLIAIATVADHHPISRRDLVAAGLDPNEPAHGRGLCASCHSTATTSAQPGGFLLRHSE